MNITITGKRTTIRDPFKERAQKKLQKLDRFFGEDVNASIVVSTVKDRETVEVTIQSNGMFFRSEKTTADRADSLDAVVDSLFRQIVKNKTKLEARLRSNAFDPGLEGSAEPEEEFVVTRSKRFPIKPITIDEAILEMNMLGHEFYMFRNAESGEINVVYRRKGGNYGLIEPEED